MISLFSLCILPSPSLLFLSSKHHVHRQDFPLLPALKSVVISVMSRMGMGTDLLHSAWKQKHRNTAEHVGKMHVCGCAAFLVV